MHPTRPAKPSGHGRVAALVTAATLLLAACGASTPIAPAPTASATASSPDAGATAPVAIDPASGAGSSVASTPLGSVASLAGGLFPNGLLIADRGNGRILAVTSTGKVFWQFPIKGSVPAGQVFAADDAFVDPSGTTIVANDEFHQVIDRIDITTRKVIWQYGHYNVPGSGVGYLHNPDDAYPLANGDIVVADIMNCRILEIAPDKSIVHTWGQTGRCADHAPTTYGDPNGDTPLPDGGLLITEIHGSRVVRLSPTGKVLFDIHVPVAYPSDAQIDSQGHVIVVDYSNPGAVVAMTQQGKLLWRYAPTTGRGRMDHPSLGTPLPNGDIVINDDARNRVIVLDPTTMKIVWQYGHTDVAGRAPGYLNDPDGHQPIPANAVF